MSDPIETLGCWLEEALEVELPGATAMTLVTADEHGQPSARIVSLKSLETDALIFTTGLWTRKASELRANPRVATVFHWPSLGRQVRAEGRAELAERRLAEDLFAARPRDHRLQTLVSRQGEPIEAIEPLRERLAALRREPDDRSLACPPDWGAVRIRPDSIELWEEGTDRLHDRLLYQRVEDGWRRQRLAP